VKKNNVRHAILTASLSLLFVATSVMAQTTLVSVNSAGTKSGNGGVSAVSRTSADGRFVVFTDTAGDLVENDTNGLEDVFVRDLQTNKTTLVSVNSARTNGGNGVSTQPGISADGRLIVFTSQATDLVGIDTGGIQNVFIRNWAAGSTTLVSVNAAGTGGGNLASTSPAIIADSQFVVYRSDASNLVANDTNGATDIFERDLFNDTTSLVSINGAGTASGNGPSLSFTFSDNLKFIAFTSRASDLVANDNNGLMDVFVRDVQFKRTRLVSVNDAGTNSANKASDVPIISADGHAVVFHSAASDLVSNDSNGVNDVFVRNLVTNKTILVSVNSAGTASGNDDSYISSSGIISADGNIVAFRSRASNLVGNDTNGTVDVFTRNLSTGTTTLVSVSANFGGGSGNNSSDGVGDSSLAVSRNGRYVAFDSSASDLVADDLLFYDTNNKQDVFVRDLQDNRTRLASVKSTGLESPNGASFLSTINDDGSAVFVSFASDLVAGDTNSEADIFASRLPQSSSNRFQFGWSTYGGSENDFTSTAFITVTRNSNSDAASVDYITSDGTAGQRSDYTVSSGTLDFAAGESSKTFQVILTDNDYLDGTRTVNLRLTNPRGASATLGAPTSAVLSIYDNEREQPTTNRIDNNIVFVRQLYEDFLNRVPAHLEDVYWLSQISGCGADDQCIHNRRVGVADAFFFEPEFQQTGAYIYRIYKAGLGLRPTYDEFISDRGQVVVGARLDQSKTFYALAFVRRDGFLALYPRSMTADQFLDALLDAIKLHSGVDLSSQRDALKNLYDGTDEGRALILKQIAGTQSFIDAEYNRSFVLMEYFGYLRRDPDQGGYDFWLAQVNKFPLRDVGIQQAMACSFITSAEYQTRFSPIVTHTNRECPQ
jgi:hypothetical protein